MKQLLTIICLIILSQIQAQNKFTVCFGFDIDEANETSNKKLSQWIVENPNVEVRKIYGYTDNVGEAIYNVDLSERRVAFVFEQLKAANMTVENVEQKGFGETRATGKSSKDRKVVVFYELKDKVLDTAIAREQTKPYTDFKKNITTAEKGDKIRIPNLNFYNNSDIILPQSRYILKELLQIMKDRPSLKIDIQGHICCQQNEEMQISRRRAEKVYTYLIHNGIDKNRLSYQSFGSKRPIHKLPEKSEQEREANRRVKIEILQN
jgi:outer membrane protein OmpA-like peptidoglycan-associated protein